MEKKKKKKKGKRKQIRNNLLSCRGKRSETPWVEPGGDT